MAATDVFRITQPVVLLLLHLMIHVWSVEGQYHGKLIGSFEPPTAHQVAGTVYAADATTLRIIGFSYDGSAPDAFLWGGESGSPSSQGFIIPDEQGRELKLGRYTNKNIEVTLPAGKTVAGLAWVSVWCRAFNANFGDVSIPANFVAPAEHNLGALGFSRRVHNTYASAVKILDEKRIRMENLDYDGLGPRAFFWVGPGGNPSNNGDYAIPDERGSTAVIRSYNDATITLTLPDGVSVFDIGHIGLWCIAFSQDFGHVDIPAQANLNIPPAPLGTGGGSPVTDMPAPMAFPNCETLVEDEFQVSWTIDGSDIVIQLSSTNDAGEYAAFGISGRPDATQMVGGDVVVAFIDGSGDAQVVDYYLESQAQCSPQNGAGACPDTIASVTASNQATLEEAYVENGVTHIAFRRPLAATDSTFDQAIVTDGPMYVIWARGSINADGRVAYHNQQRSASSSNLQIDFGRASSTCPGLNQGATAPPISDGWTIPGIKKLGNATFTLEMGLSGGRKGYDSITKRVGWGIAWFVNGQLIPELTLKRGSTYTFRVSGGDDPSESANYHPFYITDDPDGGYAQLPEEDRQGITIYAGPEEGPLCQWMNTASTGDPSRFGTYAGYKATLTKTCDPGDPGILVWTIPMDAPDLLYYHCYTHRFLGWKIHVTDSAPTRSFSVITLAILFFSTQLLSRS